jgi:hypothetical protein
MFEDLVSGLLSTPAISFSSTFAGVFLAYFLASRYDRGKRHQEEIEGKKRVLGAIQLELNTVLKWLKATDPNAVIGALRTAAFNTAVASGLFSHFTSKLQDSLSNLYVDINWHDKMYEMEIRMTGYSGSAWSMRGNLKLMALQKKLLESAQVLMKEIPDTLGEVEKELEGLLPISRWKWLSKRKKSGEGLSPSKSNELTLQGLFDTGSLFLAVVAGIWEGSLFQNNPTLLYEIEAAISIPPLIVLAILAKYRIGSSFTFTKLLLKGLTWATAVIAGNVFTAGYGYVFSFVWPYGLIWLPLYFLIVAVIMGTIKMYEYRLDIRKREWEKTHNEQERTQT